MATLGERLRSLIDERGIKQKEVAHLLGIKPSTIHGYLTNDRSPDIDMQIKLADYFGVTVDYLIGYTDSRYGEDSENTSMQIAHLNKQMNTFINDPSNTEYIRLACSLQSKNIAISSLRELDAIITSENFTSYLELIKKIERKGINPAQIDGFKLKVKI